MAVHNINRTQKNYIEYCLLRFQFHWFTKPEVLKLPYSSTFLPRRVTTMSLFDSEIKEAI